MGAHEGWEDLEWVTAVFGFRCAWCFEIVRGTEASSRLLRFGSGAHAQRGDRGANVRCSSEGGHSRCGCSEAAPAQASRIIGPQLLACFVIFAERCDPLLLSLKLDRTCASSPSPSPPTPSPCPVAAPPSATPPISAQHQAATRPPSTPLHAHARPAPHSGSHRYSASLPPSQTLPRDTRRPSPLSSYPPTFGQYRRARGFRPQAAAVKRRDETR
ncbi:hypothetical protein B0H14DRAFT_542667 [Mycena olivaceomarginata]|nr:hypothetical protein B0H14DRAFT_542667 [Mycena olivaceomarginata]